ncbi:hypothetical protein [Microvirga rosea]|uniref:hypothetical protein n=1 Tax=Microvirga rosea TaxID=2715425 RepID=UPI001D09B8AC|nr:hypothetical protein [Microvirga rosea]MCB8819842.1 hypothetical protein [Microvirga rosea]
MIQPVGFVILTFLLLGALLWTWATFTESGQIAVCLDDGGRWSYEQRKCEGSRSAP